MASVVAQTVKMTVMTNSFIVYLPQQWAVKSLYRYGVGFSITRLHFICYFRLLWDVTSVFDNVFSIEPTLPPLYTSLAFVFLFLK